MSIMFVQENIQEGEKEIPPVQMIVDNNDAVFRVYSAGPCECRV